MEEKKSNNKKIAIIAALIAVIIIVVGVVSIVNDRTQREIIGQEMEEINNSGEVNEEIKAKGRYAEVEKALKDYIIEYQAIANEIATEYQNEKFATILSAENYQNDGPNFEETKQLISEVKTKGEETKTKLAEMVTEDFKEKRATEVELTGKYKQLFKDSIELEKELIEINKTIDNVNQYLDKVDEVFNFLKENGGKWSIKNDKIEFKEISLVTQYNALVASVNTAASNLE